MNPTHDWHVADGMELLISRDEVDSVSVRLGHENIDDAHGTLIITSRLLEMIDSVQPGAVRAYLSEQAPSDAEVEALVDSLDWAIRGTTDGDRIDQDSELPVGEVVRLIHEGARAALSAARAARRDEEKR